MANIFKIMSAKCALQRSKDRINETRDKYSRDIRKSIFHASGNGLTHITDWVDPFAMSLYKNDIVPLLVTLGYEVKLDNEPFCDGTYKIRINWGIDK